MSSRIRSPPFPRFATSTSTSNHNAAASVLISPPTLPLALLTTLLLISPLPLTSSLSDADLARTRRDAAQHHPHNNIRVRSLPPGPLNMGYATNCDHEKILHSVRTGLNVLFWFAISIVTDPETGKPVVHSTIDLQCVTDLSILLQSQGLPTTHMVTLGGWNAPHIPDAHSAAEVYSTWKDWNEGVVARPGFDAGFAGLDWDLEGYDDVTHPNNHFTVQCINSMGVVSQLAKRDGYLVSLVPAESYMDPSTSLFDRSLLHTYPEWHPEFTYHGHNTYALVLSKFQYTTLADNSTAPTFDLVSVQLYETWSHANFNVTSRLPSSTRQTAAEYLISWARTLYRGWEVDFGADPEVQWPTRTVTVSPSQLVVGLANAWAVGPKWVLIQPEEAGEAYRALAEQGEAPRGFVFYDISNEGQINPVDQRPLFLAERLNEFLGIRPVGGASGKPSDEL